MGKRKRCVEVTELSDGPKRVDEHTVFVGRRWSEWLGVVGPAVYPLVVSYSLLLKIAIEIVDFHINSIVIFHSLLYVYQAGYLVFLW
jgi:uncharacterized membrane protein (DUF2068 family)